MKKLNQKYWEERERVDEALIRLRMCEVRMSMEVGVAEWKDPQASLLPSPSSAILQRSFLSCRLYRVMMYEASALNFGEGCRSGAARRGEIALAWV